MVDDRQQPRLHAAAPLDVSGGIAPCAQERVLDDILGEARVIRDAVGDRVGHRLVSVVQILESIELPIGETDEHSPVLVVRRGRGTESEGLVRLGHPVVRTANGFGSPCPSSRSVAPAIAAATSSAGREADEGEAFGLGGGKGEEAVAHAPVEGQVELGLEARHVTRGDTRETRPTGTSTRIVMSGRRPSVAVSSRARSRSIETPAP